MTAAMNTRDRYGNVAMTLHWLIALLLIGNLCSGFFLANIMDDDNPWHFTFIQIHKSVGLTILTLSVLRLVWRLVNPIPPFPPGMSLFLRIVARGTHYLFYFLIIAIPLAGWAWVSSSTKGIPTHYFGLFPWPNIPFLADLPRAQKIANGHMFHAFHIYLAYSAALLLVLHVAGALYHQFFRQDEVLRRNWFGTRIEGRT
ncbi:MAG TPA: cytochrome b [Rhizomicrobium sp.]|jgi:cytochrome b561